MIHMRVPSQPWLFVLAAIAATCAPDCLAAGATSAPSANVISDADARLTLARTLSYKDESLSQAAEQYERLLNDQPASRNARLEYVEVLMRLKRYDAARNQLATLLGDTPKDERAILLDARLDLWTGQAVDAAAKLAPLRAGGRPEVLRELARAYAWSGRPELALDVYEALIKLTPAPDAGFCEDVGDAALYARRFDQAVAWYGKALERQPDAAGPKNKLVLARARQGGGQANILADLEAAHARAPQDRDLVLELARACVRAGRTPRAVAVLETFLTKHPDDGECRMEMVLLETSLGHADRATATMAALPKGIADNPAMRLQWASAMTRWGDLFTAERICRDTLSARPWEARLCLAQVLIAGWRMNEAEGEYRRLLLDRPASTEVLAGLAGLLLDTRRTAEASQVLDALLATTPDDSEALFLKAVALEKSNRVPEALKIYERLENIQHLLDRARLARARLFAAGNDEPGAQALAREVMKSDPSNVDAAFLLQSRNASSYLPSVRAMETDSPGALEAWAKALATRGRYSEAIPYLEAKIEMDPACLPARIALAEARASARNDNAALALYDDLLKAYPGNARLRLGYARLLSWMKRYDDSLAAYDKILALRFEDVLSLRERARVAYWAKAPQEAERTYDQALTPDVDAALYDVLSAPHLDLVPVMRALNSRERHQASFDGYLTAQAAWLAIQSDFTAVRARAVDEIFVKFLPAWRSQHAIRLERDAKHLLWCGRLLEAERAYQALVAWEPDNQEAQFDLGQVQALQGLHDRAIGTYGNLLADDSLHNQARLALEREQHLQQPAAKAEYRYWNENGYGDLAQIRRQSGRVAAELPLAGRLRVQAAAMTWLESPHGDYKSKEAMGPELEIDGKALPGLEVGAGVVRKLYQDSALDDTTSGHLDARVDLTHGLSLGAGWRRQDELYNVFGLEQALQSDTFSISPRLQAGHALTLREESALVNYTDDNSAQRHELRAELMLLDHPRTLTAMLQGQYRDTRETAVSVYTNNVVADIVHPYWTPTDYWAINAGLQWRHDLSAQYFANAPQHFYELALIVGTDTENNPSVEGRAMWKFDACRNLTLEAGGLIHRSREWNAESLQAGALYRF